MTKLRELIDEKTRDDAWKQSRKSVAEAIRAVREVILVSPLVADWRERIAGFPEESHVVVSESLMKEAATLEAIEIVIAQAIEFDRPCTEH